MLKPTSAQVIDDWIQSRCVLGGHVLLATAYEDYSDWCELHGFNRATKYGWGKLLSAKGFRSFRFIKDWHKSGFTLAK